ncbi:MAG: hypothetical protein WD696_15365 [Bryobacteraceae bacterium]
MADEPLSNSLRDQYHLDHTKLTFYHNGIQRRLTDVHGHVVRDLLA